MNTVLLLFSDHVWYQCFENQIEDFISNHKWKMPWGYVLIIRDWDKHELREVHV